MPPDLHADADELARSLRAHGFDDWADQLTEDIAAGSTGTEILMRLRATLARLVASEPGLPAPLRREADRQVRALTKVVR